MIEGRYSALFEIGPSAKLPRSPPWQQLRKGAIAFYLAELLERQIALVIRDGQPALDARMQVVAERLVAAVNVAALHAARHERTVGILDELVGDSASTFGIGFVAGPRYDCS